MRQWATIIIAIVALGVVALIALVPRSSDDDAARTRWFKGNTHTHSLWSDGNDFPEMIADWYKERGYDFLALSDHNVLSRGERWMKVGAVEKRRKVEGERVLGKYRQRFGEEWVETRGEGENSEVRLKTLEEIRPQFEADNDFLLIEAEEITDRFRKQEVHINAVNLAEVIPPQHGATLVRTIRNNLRAVEEQAKNTGRPILAHINHPNFRWSLTARDIALAIEDRFFEVYNGHPGINHLGDDSHPGDEEIWDIANTIRLTELDAPPLYGVATDDSHTYHGGKVSPGRGWVMVRAERLDAGALVEAMKRGEFYASTGVTLERIAFDDESGALRLDIVPTEGITFETRFIGTRKDTPGEPGIVFSTAHGSAPTYQLTGEELYVRATVTSSRAHPNPSFDGQREQAWVQPVGW